MITNHHDLFVRQIFSQKENSIEFFQVTLPKPVTSLLDIRNIQEIQATEEIHSQFPFASV